MIGPAYARRLKRLGITTLGDLLYYFPFRYLDYSLSSPIFQLQAGEIATVKGQVSDFKNEYTKSGKKIQKAEVKDQSGSIQVIWFNQPFLIKTLKIGTRLSLSGKVDFWGSKIALISPEYEVLKNTPAVHTGRLVPIYHETYGISSKWLRSRLAPLINNSPFKVEEFLPISILEDYHLLEISQALKQIHFPVNLAQAESARQRFAFEELFLLQLQALKRKQAWLRKKLVQKFNLQEDKIRLFEQSFPFKLTSAQKRVIREILTDLQKDKPMNRLLQGDVGSGKTVVAAVAVYVAYLNGCQSALMAPTEILAEQHYATLNQLLKPFGLKIALFTSSSKRTPAFDLAIGTQALIYKSAKFKNLGLVVIDEQHRFGVRQRSQLLKKGAAPHLLTMTATPIPRTIALTLYGDLELSVLDEMPPGRQLTKTWVVPAFKREAAYKWIETQIRTLKTKVFIVCPLIEESLSETLSSIKAVTTEFERLKTAVFPNLKLGLLHGRLKAQEKKQILQDFSKKLDILVTTPVVEVGIDIPQATIMLIEGAERFGLAQLHQLRGRVGRNTRPSYCLLFAQKAHQRLRTLEQTNIGFKLAEFDLKMRGPGEIYGLKQHGFTDLKVASFSDLPLIEKTRKAAQKILPQIVNYPSLQQRLKEDIIKSIEPN